MINYVIGELLYDETHEEFFAYNQKRDKYMILNRPETVRKATQEEIDNYNEFIKVYDNTQKK